MKKPSVLCEYGEVKDNSIFCNRVNSNCVFVRWCTTLECIKNSEGYKTCKARTEVKPEMKEKDRVEIKTKNIESMEEPTLKIDKNDYIEEYCQIIWKKEHAFAIDFYGYGLSFHTKNDENYFDDFLIGDTIKLKYKGKIGETDFEIHPVYS